LFAIYSIAESLHKTIAEIEEMTVEEFIGWIAYFNKKAKDGNTRRNQNQDHR
jgi:hypothetical protein